MNPRDEIRVKAYPINQETDSFVDYVIGNLTDAVRDAYNLANVGKYHTVLVWLNYLEVVKFGAWTTISVLDRPRLIIEPPPC